MIRLKDIAREAGVSVMTVSKALRDAPDIAAKTKLRIGDLAKRMGYTPNLGARSLRSQETKLLGLVIPATTCLLYTSPSPRDVEESRMPSSA